MSTHHNINLLSVNIKNIAVLARNESKNSAVYGKTAPNYDISLFCQRAAVGNFKYQYIARDKIVCVDVNKQLLAVAAFAQKLITAIFLIRAEIYNAFARFNHIKIIAELIFCIILRVLEGQPARTVI